MSIAEKLTTIAENEQKVYDAGVEQGKQAGADYARFWDVFQANGTRTSYLYGFSGMGWNDVTYKPRYPIKPLNATYMFRCSKIKTSYDVDYSICKNTYGIYADCTELVSVGDVYTANAPNANELFYNCPMLIKTGVITVNEYTTYNWAFYNCTALTDITFAGLIGQGLDFRYSPLSKASIENIIGRLSATVTGRTLFLKKSAVNTAFGSTSSSEWTALTGSKTNWTISLV